MNRVDLSRRTLLKQGGVALTGWALLNTMKIGATPVVLAQAGVEVLPWLEQPGENPTGGRVTNLLEWQELDSWVTPPDNFFQRASLQPPRDQRG